MRFELLCCAIRNCKSCLRGSGVPESIGHLHRDCVLSRTGTPNIELIVFLWGIRELPDGKDDLPVVGVEAVLRAGDCTRGTNALERYLHSGPGGIGVQIFDLRRSVGYLEAVAL